MRAARQLVDDALGDLADGGVGDGEDDDVGALDRLLGRPAVGAEALLDPRLTRLAHLDMAYGKGRFGEILRQPLSHLPARTE